MPSVSNFAKGKSRIVKRTGKTYNYSMDIKGLIKSVDRSPLFGNEKYGKNFDDSVQCADAAFPFPVTIVVRPGAIVDNLSRRIQ